MTSGEDSDQLSADDARILNLESTAVTGHTLKLVILEPGSGPLDLDTLRDSVARRLVAQPLATKRVDTTGPDPRWVSAPEFNIADHIRHVPTPDGGSEADLRRIVSALMSEHLDRNRPLWTFDVIGPLADGREAIAARIHHAMADGIAGVRFLETVLFDEQDSDDSLAGNSRPGLRAGAADSDRAEEALRMPGVLWRELGHPGSHSPFDQPITAARELAFSVAPMAEMKRIGGSRPDHATVNDVLLAIIAGGLREWLHAGGVRARHLRAQVPVSLHHREDAGTAGNHDSFINIDLPLHEENPLTRLDLISRETTKRKQLDDAEEIYDLFHALGRVKRLDRAVQHLAGSAREFSLAISNVPGPAVGVSIYGRRVQNLFSSSEPGAHHSLRISAISCDGDIGIGLCTDPSALPGIPELADAITRSYAELRDASAG